MGTVPLDTLGLGVPAQVDLLVKRNLSIFVCAFHCRCANSEEGKTLLRSYWDGLELTLQGHKDGRDKASQGLG